MIKQKRSTIKTKRELTVADVKRYIEQQRLICQTLYNNADQVVKAKDIASYKAKQKALDAAYLSILTYIDINDATWMDD